MPTAPDGTPITSAGATAQDVFNGTLSSFAVAIGLAAVAFLLGAATGRKGLALGAATGLGIGGYVLYTLSNMTDSLEPLTWISPWRWYVADAMLIKGLTWNVLLPFMAATAGLLIGLVGLRPPRPPEPVTHPNGGHAAVPRRAQLARTERSGTAIRRMARARR